MNNFKQRLKDVRCFVFDVDGVLTDGSLYLMPDDLVRVMNIRDGFAMKQAIVSGYIVAVISGGSSEGVRYRLNKLGIKDVFLGIENKNEKLNELIQTYKLKKEEILFMGDDLPDFEVMAKSGIPCCPNDAVPEIAELSIYVSPYKGGKGCVRDVIEQTLRLHGKWPKISNIKND
jgi:3-deoxy-D-manno-octulosonate 8-phosphate phosphatase (KDO 8-P phosphatase)